MSFSTPARIIIDSISEEEGVEKPILTATVCNGKYHISHCNQRPRVSFVVPLCGSLDELKRYVRDLVSPYFPNGAEIVFS